MSILSHLNPQYAWITLDHLQLEVIIGLLPHERVEKQRLQVELALGLSKSELWRCGGQGTLEDSINYAEVAAWVEFISSYGTFRLLESLSLSIMRLICSPPAPYEERAQIEAVWCGFWKPDILPSSRPGVCVYAQADEIRVLDQTIYLSSDPPADLLSDLEGLPYIEVLIHISEVTIFRVICPKDESVQWGLSPHDMIYVISGDWRLKERGQEQLKWGECAHLGQGESAQGESARGESAQEESAQRLITQPKDDDQHKELTVGQSIRCDRGGGLLCVRVNEAKPTSIKGSSEAKLDQGIN